MRLWIVAVTATVGSARLLGHAASAPPTFELAIPTPVGSARLLGRAFVFIRSTRAEFG